MNRVGSLALVDAKRSIKYAPFYVAEARIRNMRKWKLSIILGTLSNPIFMMLSVGIGVGSFINSRSAGHGMDGVPYMTFLAPALLATVCLQDAMAETTFPVLQGFKWERTFFSMNATPIGPNDIAMGTFYAAILRTIFSSIIYYFVMMMFGVVHGVRPMFSMITAVLGGMAFAALMLGATAAIENDDFFLALVGRFLIMPIFLFSGTFYPLTSMPKLLQLLGWLSPLWHATELGRWLSYGHHISTTAVLLHLAYMVVMTYFGLRFARNRFRWRLSK